MIIFESELILTVLCMIVLGLYSCLLEPGAGKAACQLAGGQARQPGWLLTYRECTPRPKDKKGRFFKFIFYFKSSLCPLSLSYISLCQPFPLIPKTDPCPLKQPLQSHIFYFINQPSTLYLCIYPPSPDSPFPLFLP